MTLLSLIKNSRYFTAVFLFIFFAACQRETIVNQDPPNALFTYTSSLNLPVGVQFTNLSIVQPGTSFLWDFGDGAVSTTANNPLHYYVVYGTYMVSLAAIPPAGPSDTLRMAINLAGTGPSGMSGRNNIASFAYSINKTYTATFTNTSTLATSYLWDFGNGATSSSAAATVTASFNAPGTYHVKLTATGPGGTDTCSANITF